MRVVTALPTYPTGKLYPDFRLVPLSRSDEAGVRIDRVACYPYQPRGLIRRVAAYVSFTAAAGILLVFEPKPDVLYAYHPPITVGLLAAAYARATGTPLVYDVQDIWPEAIIASGAIPLDGAIARALHRMERLIYRNARSIAVLSENMRANLVSKGALETSLHVVANWGDEATYYPTDGKHERDRRHWNDRFVVMIAGNLSPTHQLHHVVMAARELEHTAVSLVFVGGGQAKRGLIQLAREQRMRNVEFLDRVTPPAAARLINAADAMLIHLPSEGGAEFSVPHRVHSYLLCAKPILAANDGSLSEMVQNSGCGWTCSPCNATELGTLLRTVAQDPQECYRRGQISMQLAHSTYGREARLRELEDLICQAAIARRP